MKTKEKKNLILIFQSVLIGLAVGIIIGFFRFGIEKVTSGWLKLYKYSHQNSVWLVLIILLLILTGVITGLFVKQQPHVGGSGVPEVKLQMQGKLTLQWWPILWRKLFGGILAIGSGIFVGAEGPSVQLGSTLGQGISQYFKQNKSNTRVLIATGAASGLSAVFGAPLSGVLFVLEEVFHNFSTRVWVNALIGAITANFVTSNLFGQKPVLQLPYKHMFPLQLYWQLIILGILLGLLGYLFKKDLFKIKEIYKKIRFIPHWLHGLIPLFLLIPIMYYLPIITGPGDRLIFYLQKLIDKPSWTLVGIIFGFYLLRFVFSCISYGAELPSGIFSPILTMGALIGALYGLIMFQLGLMPKYLIINLIIFAMAGYFVAIIRAPFTAIILVTEMVGSVLHLMPLAVVAVVSLLIDQFLGGKPLYDTLAKNMSLKNSSDQTAHGEDQLTIPIYENSKIANKRVREISWPEETLIKVIHRGSYDIIPDGDTEICIGDLLVFVVKQDQRGKIYDKLAMLQGTNFDR